MSSKWSKRRRINEKLQEINAAQSLYTAEMNVCTKAVLTLIVAVLTEINVIHVVLQ